METLLSASLFDSRNRLFSLVPLSFNLTLSLSFPRKPPQMKTPFSSHYSSTSDLMTTPLTLDRISPFCAFPYHRSRNDKTAHQR